MYELYGVFHTLWHELLYRIHAHISIMGHRAICPWTRGYQSKIFFFFLYLLFLSLYFLYSPRVHKYIYAYRPAKDQQTRRDARPINVARPAAADVEVEMHISWLMHK